jgi:hypothetical protein
MKIVNPKKDVEFFIGGNALTLTTKGGNVENRQTGDGKKKRRRSKKITTPHQ